MKRLIGALALAVAAAGAVAEEAPSLIPDQIVAARAVGLAGVADGKALFGISGTSYFSNKWALSIASDFNYYNDILSNYWSVGLRYNLVGDHTKNGLFITAMPGVLTVYPLGKPQSYFFYGASVGYQYALGPAYVSAEFPFLGIPGLNVMGFYGGTLSVGWTFNVRDMSRVAEAASL